MLFRSDENSFRRLKKSDDSCLPNKNLLNLIHTSPVRHTRYKMEIGSGTGVVPFMNAELEADGPDLSDRLLAGCQQLLLRHIQLLHVAQSLKNSRN